MQFHVECYSFDEKACQTSVFFFLSRTSLLKESPLPVSPSFCDSQLTVSRIKLIVYYLAEAVQ